ncbi:hypothetical protein [Salmonella sp. gx-f5]|nr:hypothetical protein [Salmonella sp. gx-f5]
MKHNDRKASFTLTDIHISVQLQAVRRKQLALKQDKEIGKELDFYCT